jgi:hypothetical protein
MKIKIMHENQTTAILQKCKEKANILDDKIWVLKTIVCNNWTSKIESDLALAVCTMMMLKFLGLGSKIC